MTNEIADAWAAGLFEGEGTVAVASQQKGRYRYMQLALSSTDEDVVRKFLTVVGVGRIYGPRVPGGNRKPYWTWRVQQREDVIALWERFAPHMGLRRSAKFQEAISWMGPRRRRVLAKCGTISGPARHRREGTEICDDCRQAIRDYQRAAYAHRRIEIDDGDGDDDDTAANG